MIAFIRARFPNTPASQLWTDAVVDNWMNPTIPFSAAHYWKQSTFQQIDFSYVKFAPVVLNDPRQGNTNDRDVLVRAVLAAVDAASHPNWDQFERCIIFFAQPTDTFGGGTHVGPNGRGIIAAVFDNASGFDSTCQEIGHTFGLRHELGDWYRDAYGQFTNEYGCPYSVMSAAGELSFERAPDPRLPGVLGPTNPQRIIGPYVPTAHLYINQYRAVNPAGVFNHPDTVTYLSTTYEHAPANVRLYARDAAVAAWPNRRTVLVVVPPIVPAGDTHFLELRRKDGAYDGSINSACITILAANFFVGNHAVDDVSTLRLRYVGCLDLEGVEGDLDFHSFSGHFVVRVSIAAAGFSSVNLSIGGGNAWQDFRLNLDEQIKDRKPLAPGDWTPALAAPCPLDSKREFNFRINTFETFFVLQAQSAGYEAPGYAWKVQGVRLDPADSWLNLDVSCRSNTGHLLDPPALHPVQCRYAMKRGRLELSILSHFADITLGIEVTVGESSPSVMKNFYPERTLWTSVHTNNLAIEWDSAYHEASAACWKRFRSFSNQIPKYVVPHPVPGDPEPRYFDHMGIRELIRILAERDPRAARGVASVIADKAAVPVERILELALAKNFREG